MLSTVSDDDDYNDEDDNNDGDDNDDDNGDNDDEKAPARSRGMGGIRYLNAAPCSKRYP